MPTGQAFAAFNLKQLLGWQDLGVRGMAALRANHVEATAARWDVDGVFNTKLTMSSPGANKVQVDGTSKATDGLGHVLTISAAYKKVADFQNSGGITYHVGFMYAEVPTGLRINPRTGKPQFDRYTEEVGFAGIPTSVTDNGNGTITFNVNSVTESGVSNAGRLVRVYKVVPADGATTFAMALEECTVAFGTNNTITTVGKFGQTTVSTTAGDYIVVCMGPRVSRNTDLSTVSGVVYVGTVLGNGGTPVTFSNTNQTLLKTFTDASQVTYTPAGWLAPGATNVQLALDALVNGLQASTPSGILSGAQRVGVYAPDYATVSGGGIGNVADSTFTTSATVRDLGMAVDRAIKRRFAYWVKNDGTFSDADDSTGTSITNSMAGRPMWVRTLNNAATTPYTWGSDTSGTSLSSYMVGEFADVTQANAHLRFTRLNHGAGARAVSGNKWERLWLDATAGASYRFGGTAQRSGLIAQLCGFNGGSLLVDGCASTSNQDWGFNFRNGIVVPKDETTKAFAASVQFGNATSAFLWSVWENMLVYGPSATQTSPAGAGYALRIGSQITGPLNAATVASQSRPLVFRDCVFIMQRTADTTVVSLNGDAPVLFENCRFFGIAGHASGSAIVGASGVNVTMRDCIVFDPEGMCLYFGPGSGVSGLMDNVTLVAGIGGSGIPTAPTVMFANGNGFGLSIDDCTVLLGSSVWRSNATATTTPLIKLGNTIVGNVSVRNMVVKVEGATDLGFARIVDVVGGAPNLAGCSIDGLSINCSSFLFSTAATNLSCVRFSNCMLSKFQFVNWDHSLTVVFLQSAVEFATNVQANTFFIVGPINSGGVNGKFKAGLYVSGNNNSLSQITFINGGNFNCNDGAIFVSGTGNIVDSVTSDNALGSSNSSATVGLLKCTGNDNIFTEFNLSSLSDVSIPAISITGRDVSLQQSLIKFTSVGSPTAVPLQCSTGRRAKVTGCTFHWDGTTVGCVSSTSPESLLDSTVFYRSAGATAAAAGWAGSGSVTGSIILSTTL